MEVTQFVKLFDFYEIFLKNWQKNEFRNNTPFMYCLLAILPQPCLGSNSA